MIGIIVLDASRNFLFKGAVWNNSAVIFRSIMKHIYKLLSGATERFYLGVAHTR